LQRISRWLILVILVISAVSMVKPAQAQGFAVSVAPNMINTSMSSVALVTVSVQTIDPLVAGHVVNLALSVAGGWWWGASFNPPSVILPVPPGIVTSTLTLPVPGPENVCPGQSTPGPYSVMFAVIGTDTVTTLSASASLVVNLLPITYPLTVNVEPSKTSYMKGETITLKMDSNLRAEYSLTVRKPDGSVWKRASGILPATWSAKAADPLGTYTAELMAYYCGVAQDTATFSVTPDTYDVTISLNGLPPDAVTELVVDGNKVADMKGGDVRVLEYPIGTPHTFQVSQYVSGASGYRYYCASNSWSANAEGTNVFNYATQVYLDVSTDPTGATDVTASSWYALGSSASISAVPTEVEPSEGTKYLFIEWTVDGTTRSGNGFTIVMDTPHKVVAKFDTMYLLTIESPYGRPTGGKYYKAGETAEFSVTTPDGIGIQHVFVEYTGDFQGKDPKGSLVMDGPKRVVAVWTTSYFQLYLIIGVIAAIAAVAGVLLWRRRTAGPAAVKPPPPPTPTPTETPATPEEPSPPAPEPETTAKPPVSIALRCTNCGHELKEGQVYCPECGQKQTD